MKTPTRRLLRGDCRTLIPTFSDNSIDAIVTDPPYHLTSGNLAVDWSSFKGPNSYGTPPEQRGSTNHTGRRHGFMGKEWDGGDVAFRPETWRAMLRVLKPGGHLVAFGGTRTYHRLACAIEDAGFEIRDQLAWVYGQGFPKSLDVSKAIDREAGAKREIVGIDSARAGRLVNQQDEYTTEAGWSAGNRSITITRPATDAAKEWDGWGTALKPAWEPIVLARKPLSESTVAANVLRWGTGALNIDGCRIETGEDLNGGTYGCRVTTRGLSNGWHRLKNGIGEYKPPQGRWPANFTHDGSQQVLDLFPNSTSGTLGSNRNEPKNKRVYGAYSGDYVGLERSASTGSAARFFYCAKASPTERNGSKHPTIKPLALMRWLCRLVTPPNGTILDPFAGSGTTGEAAQLEGFSITMIEREPQYQFDIEARLEMVTS